MQPEVFKALAPKDKKPILENMLKVRGMTFTQVGLELEISRSAVAGLAHRLGLTMSRVLREAEQRVARQKKIEATSIRTTADTKVRIAKMKEHTPKPGRAVPDIWTPLAGTEPVALMDAPVGQGCRWIVGKHQFCGQAGYPYCPTHAARVYTNREDKHAA